MNIIDKQNGKVIGTIFTNHSVSLYEAFEIAGFEWKTTAEDGVECDGWYKDGVFYDESVAELSA